MSDKPKYRLFHKETGEALGAASDLCSLGTLVMDLFHEDGIWSHLIRIEEVEN
jgi:hypothetical protein